MQHCGNLANTTTTDRMDADHDDGVALGEDDMDISGRKIFADLY